MAPGSAQTPSREPPQDGARASADERAAGAPPPGEERLGPLAILRTRKADGRALLLYSRVEREVDADASAGEAA
jgi:hypothetical protein